jgi:hypothetical protein
MQTVMALPTNINTLSQFIFAVVLLEKIPPMHLLWDQVMEGQVRLSMTQGTFA